MTSNGKVIEIKAGATTHKNKRAGESKSVNSQRASSSRSTTENKSIKVAVNSFLWIYSGTLGASHHHDYYYSHNPSLRHSKKQ